MLTFQPLLTDNFSQWASCDNCNDCHSGNSSDCCNSQKHQRPKRSWNLLDERRNIFKFQQPSPVSPWFNPLWLTDNLHKHHTTKLRAVFCPSSPPEWCANRGTLRGADLAANSLLLIIPPSTVVRRSRVNKMNCSKQCFLLSRSKKVTDHSLFYFFSLS